MEQQAGGEGPALDAAAAAGGAGAAAANLLAPLAQLAEVLKADFHDPLTVCPQKFLSVMFAANFSKYEQAEIDQVRSVISRVVETLVVAATTRALDKRSWEALAFTLQNIGIQLPKLPEDVPAVPAANSAASSKKSEYHFAAMRTASLLAERFNSLGALRAIAAKLKLDKGFGLTPAAVAAFAKLHWQAWQGGPGSKKVTTLLESTIEGIRTDKAHNETTLLCLSWSALADFLSAVSPEGLPGGDTAEAFAVSVERGVIHPLMAEGCSPGEVARVLEDHVLAPLANRMSEVSEDPSPVAFNAWAEVRATLDVKAVCRAEVDKRRVPGNDALREKLMPATIISALHEACGVLLGGALPRTWRALCVDANVCPMHTLVPELCPYGDTSCPAHHLQEEERQELINKAFGDRNPSVLNLWERATRAGELARHKLSRPGTYVPTGTTASPPPMSGGKKSGR